MSLDISNLFSVESKVTVTGGSRGIGEKFRGFLVNGAKVTSQLEKRMH